MNSTPTPNAGEPGERSIASTDERLAEAHKQIVRADEELTRLSERLAKMERDAAPSPPAQSDAPLVEPAPASSGPGSQSSSGRPAFRAFGALSLAACVVIAALASQSSYGARAKLVVARWVPQLASTPSSPRDDPPLPAQPAPSAVQVAAAEAAPQQPTPAPSTAPQDAAPKAMQDTAPPVPAALPDRTELLQTIARDLANVQRNIEQLKADQQQAARESSKAIEELKASQEELKRALAKVSEQKTSSPPAQPAPTSRKPQRTYEPPYARAPPRMQREWLYDDW
ncbi:hypothetical protein [Bradyrhizobium sp. RD5-C2]|uniref:hypothetical protein n=1 Tax=Bradyrhizobium sp. RD5-C2 TaxID=244562 RepID=UPI001CC4BE1B|nr:hypothetical protein [Bradyrhizobium sp. RD5-C2]